MTRRAAPARAIAPLVAKGIALAPAARAAAKAAAQLKILGPPPAPPGCELRVRGRLHSRARDQAVIAGHYDLTAAFYQLILDPSMAYSGACWAPGTTTLADAQRAKLELFCRKLGLEPGQRLLDMGCGWGSLTIHAALARVQVTGVTLSREQGGYVRQRARGLGLDRAEVGIQDYRDPLDDRPTPAERAAVPPSRKDSSQRPTRPPLPTRTVPGLPRFNESGVLPHRFIRTSRSLIFAPSRHPRAGATGPTRCPVWGDMCGWDRAAGQSAVEA